MALVPCKECGKEISDQAKVCPNCGISDPGTYGPGELVIVRKKQFSGAAVPLTISINGKDAGNLKYGESVTYDLEAGTYTIQSRNWLRKSDVYRVKIVNGHTTMIETYIDFWGKIIINNYTG